MLSKKSVNIIYMLSRLYNTSARPAAAGARPAALARPLAAGARLPLRVMRMPHPTMKMIINTPAGGGCSSCGR